MSAQDNQNRNCRKKIQVTRGSSERLYFASTKLKRLPLNVRPVKLRESLYLLIPIDIARLVGVVTACSFSLTLSENPEGVRLVYELKKSPQDQQLVKRPAEK